MKKIILSFILILLMTGLTLPVSANENITAAFDKTSCGEGEYIRATVTYNDAGLGAFLVDMNYDPAVLRYVKTENLSGDHVRSADTNGTTKTVFTTDEGGNGQLFSVVYKVLPGTEKAAVSVRIYDMADNDGVSMGDEVTIDLAAEVIIPSGDALLLDLVPNTGELNEDFSPNTYKYSMTVPYEVESMAFEAVVSEGAKCSINRKNLGSGGSTTDFLLTVTSEDGDTKTVYTISVTRGEYVRPSGTAAGDTSDDANPSSPEPGYETVSPEFTGEEEISGEVAESIPEETTEVQRSESNINGGSNFIFFLTGAGVCLACVFAGVLIAMFFSKTGKHGKH